MGIYSTSGRYCSTTVAENLNKLKKMSAPNGMQFFILWPSVTYRVVHVIQGLFLSDRRAPLILFCAYMLKHVWLRKKWQNKIFRPQQWIFVPHCPHYYVKISNWPAVIVISLKRCASTRGIEWWSYKCPGTKITPWKLRKTADCCYCACAVTILHFPNSFSHI